MTATLLSAGRLDDRGDEIRVYETRPDDAPASQRYGRCLAYAVRCGPTAWLVRQPGRSAARLVRSRALAAATLTSLTGVPVPELEPGR